MRSNSTYEHQSLDRINVHEYFPVGHERDLAFCRRAPFFLFNKSRLCTLYTLVFRLPAGRSPPVPNRDALCATKHLARASSCLYVAAHSLFLSSSLSFPPCSPVCTTFAPSLELFRSYSRTVPPSYHPHVRASRYPVDILRTSAFSIRVPNKIFISDISNSVNRAWTISDKTCSVSS